MATRCQMCDKGGTIACIVSEFFHIPVSVKRTTDKQSGIHTRHVLCSCI